MMKNKTIRFNLLFRLKKILVNIGKNYYPKSIPKNGINKKKTKGEEGNTKAKN